MPKVAVLERREATQEKLGLLMAGVRDEEPVAAGQADAGSGPGLDQSQL
jgi:hypothetical protein